MKVGIIQDWCWSHTPNGRVGGLLLLLLLTLVCLTVTVGIYKIGVVLTRRTVGSADIRGCNQHWLVSKLKLVSFKIGVVPTRRTVGSADAWCAWPLRFDY